MLDLKFIAPPQSEAFGFLHEGAKKGREERNGVVCLAFPSAKKGVEK